jgi:hypothetical protein
MSRAELEDLAALQMSDAEFEDLAAIQIYTAKLGQAKLSIPGFLLYKKLGHYAQQAYHLAGALVEQRRKIRGEQVMIRQRRAS